MILTRAAGLRTPAAAAHAARPGRLRAVLTLWAAFTLALPAGHADQNDPRLDPLFEQLAAARDPARAAEIEERIWALWSESDDEDVTALMELAETSVMLGRLGVALDTLDDLLERAPRYAEGWNKRGAIHLAIGNFDRAALDFRRAIALEPRHFGALGDLGTVLLLEGDPERALAAFERALEIHPLSVPLRERAEKARTMISDRAV